MGCLIIFIASLIGIGFYRMKQPGITMLVIAVIFLVSTYSKDMIDFSIMAKAIVGLLLGMLIGLLIKKFTFFNLKKH